MVVLPRAITVSLMSMALLLLGCGEKAARPAAAQKTKVEQGNQVKPAPAKPASKNEKKTAANAAKPNVVKAAKVTVPKVANLKIVDFPKLKTHLAQSKAKITMVAVWATWCAPCIAEMPHLAKFYKAHKAEGLDVVALCVDDREELADEIQEVLDKIRVPFEVMLLKPEGEDAFFKAFGESYGGKLPATAVFDGSGKKRLFTRNGWTDALLKSQILPLLK